jgi:hypothetical protein
MSTTRAHGLAIAALAARMEPVELRAVIAGVERHPEQHGPGWEKYEQAAALIALHLSR